MSSVRVVAAALVGAIALGPGASGATPAPAEGQLTISMLAQVLSQPGYSVLISNFERVYPNITVDAAYAASAPLAQLETTELAAGNAPDLLTTNAGCGTAISVCVLAKAGDLAPMVKVPWTKRSLPLVTSASKYGQALVAFVPGASPYGVFTNSGLFSKLGLKVPQTFSQLLTVCQKSQAAGTAALIFDGASGPGVSLLLTDLAVATVYGKDKHWLAELKAGTVSFDGSAGWHQALQEFADMSNAGCFQPGVTGTALVAEEADFAQGQGLMAFGPSSSKGSIDALSPQFGYSFYPFPGGAAPSQTDTFVGAGTGLSVNAHSSAQNQAAAQAFIDFVARPKQDALFAQIVGYLTQYEFLKGQIPSFMSSFASVFKDDEYVMNPMGSWWNAGVLAALETDGIGLVTGQETIDDVLSAMDAAWQQGPS